VVLQSVDPNEQFRLRREWTRRRKRRRRLVALGVLLAGGAAGAAGVLVAGGSSSRPAPVGRKRVSTPAAFALARPRPLPYEIRGVHVTMALASLPGKLESYLAVPGLNTVELDVKDESGRVAFVGAAPPLARATGASGRFYDPRVAVRLARKHGDYLIGRVVVFEDPVLSEKRPALAIRTRDGGVWHNRGGLGWTNPYDERVWKYAVDVGAAAAQAGFDEIQFDYVRFPSDGDLSTAVFPGRRAELQGKTIARFAAYAARRLHPLKVRVSLDVFGLSATRDLGIGQTPRRLARYVDALYPMVYPSHYSAGEYSIPDPNAAPGSTVARSLRDFNRQLRGRRAKVIPWLQDFSLGRTYTIADVREQIAAARENHTAGFMLWNAGGVYTDGALSAP